MTLEQAAIAVFFVAVGLIAGILIGTNRMYALLVDRNKWRNLANILNQQQDSGSEGVVRLIPPGHMDESIEDLAEFLGERKEHT
jgi:hypothetical protein